MGTLGIDYGMGTTNRDSANGIRYGVISQHSILCEALNDFESDYGDPTCPKCGSVVKTLEDGVSCFETGESFEQYRHGCADFTCERCEHTLDSQDCYSDEAIGFHYSEGGYELTNCLDSDIFVIKSPYYTFAQFCSPCVPGAGNLDSAMDDGVKTYCLGHDWFEDGKAPYPVYFVETEKLVEK